ncbi:hypothetical protein [Microbacterium sp. NPDC080220]|uniref:hypothetical protein n=1 Tax=Microbacterium sp. NPDC080220 TaxID=3161017 RepID=UPI003432EBAC
MRLLRILLLVAGLAVVLTGCVSTAGLESARTPTSSRTAVSSPDDAHACTVAASEDLRIGNSVDGMPGLDDVSTMQWSSARDVRGDGSCAPAKTEPGYPAAACTMAVGDTPAYSEPADDMFAAGATDQTPARVGGETDDAVEFAYAASVWRFGSARQAAGAPLVGLIASCDGAVDRSEGGVLRYDVLEGDEPHLRVTVVDSSVLLLRSMQTAGGNGTTGLSTGSGLLPGSAIDHLEEWWLANVADVPRQP